MVPTVKRVNSKLVLHIDLDPPPENTTSGSVTITLATASTVSSSTLIAPIDTVEYVSHLASTVSIYVTNPKLPHLSDLLMALKPRLKEPTRRLPTPLPTYKLTQLHLALVQREKERRLDLPFSASTCCSYFRFHNVKSLKT